jgi:hypothetical protein
MPRALDDCVVESPPRIRLARAKHSLRPYLFSAEDELRSSVGRDRELDDFMSRGIHHHETRAAVLPELELASVVAIVVP